MDLCTGTKQRTASIHDEKWRPNDDVVLLYCSFYYGVRPIVVVSDLEMVKQILVKDFDSFVDREVC